MLRSDGGEIHVEAGAVVLACGGFPHDRQRLAQVVPTRPARAAQRRRGDSRRSWRRGAGLRRFSPRSPAAGAG
ncbi:hypothetical protein CKJ90_32490, partial [Klebsiella pneumoniae]